MKNRKLIISILILNTILLIASCASDSNTIKEIIIGKQVWMEENLNVDRFANGDEIMYAKNAEDWRKAGREGKPAYCYYYKNKENGAIYGKLYNWYAVNDPRGLAPKGWRVASDEDWYELIDFTGGKWKAGDNLKSTNLWICANSSNSNNISKGTNESEFNGLPGGLRTPSGEFQKLQQTAYWWSSNEFGTFNAWVRFFYCRKAKVEREYYDKGYGFSVRCIKGKKKVLNKKEKGNENANFEEVKIGNQILMSKNLNVSKFRNGDEIPHAKTFRDWKHAAKYGRPAWCYPYNDEELSYRGKLYNWFAANDSRGLAPDGWRIPSDVDWNILFEYKYLNGNGFLFDDEKFIKIEETERKSLNIYSCNRENSGHFREGIGTCISYPFISASNDDNIFDWEKGLIGAGSRRCWNSYYEGDCFFVRCTKE